MSTTPAVDEYKAQPIPWVSDEEWHARTNPDRDPNEAGLDPVWRIANLYQIKDRTGKFVPFVPKPEQRVLIWDIHVRKYKNLIDIKARRLGMSTYLVGIEGLDRTLFVNGHKGMLIDKTAIDARIKLKDMVRVAWDRLDPALKKAWKVNFAAEQVTALQAGKIKNDGESTFRVAVSGRGGEAHYLVVSEWGTIQFEDQSRSTEINSGAMEAAAFGTRVIETTWKGGKGGDVWAYVEKALELPDEQKNPAYDWYIRFFPWYVDPEYALVGDYNRISKEVHDYLDAMERECGVTFTAQQRFWYWHKEGTARRTMKREYPTVLRECWEAPVEGAIYGEEVEKARTGGRIVDFPIDYSRPVDLFFDLGAPANTACWYIQHIEGVHHVIDYEAGLEVTLRQRIQHVKAKGFTIGAWYIPHDGGALQKGGISYQTELMAALREANLPAKVVIVPRTRSVWTGIDALLTRFKKLKFHATRTKKGIECLEAYRRRPDPSREGAFLDEVVTDWCGHSCVDGSTLIDTDQGRIPIKDMTTQHKVMLAGQACTVEWVGPTKRDKRIELTFDDGSKVITSPSHKLFTTGGLARCDTLRYGDSLWTKYHSKLRGLMNSPQGVRQAFTEHFKVTPTALGSNQVSTSARRRASLKSSSIGNCTSHATPSHQKENSRSQPWAAVRTSALKTGSYGAREPSEIYPSCGSSSPSRGSTTTSIRGIATTSTQQPASACTWPSGRQLMAQLPKGCVSITRMETRTTTPWRISNCFPSRHTLLTTPKPTSGSCQVGAPKLYGLKKQNEGQQHGTFHQKGWNGTNRMERNNGRTNPCLKSNASIVENHTPPLSPAGPSSAGRTAKAWPDTKTIVKIQHLPSTLLYDMTVPHHHAYVANGVMVSNCDALRTFAEASLHGFIPDNSDSIMTNAYFDPAIITRLSSEAVGRHSSIQMFTVTRPQHARSAIPLRDNEHGWLRVWERERLNSSYIITMTGRALAVWRAREQDQHGAQIKAAMIAAVTPDNRVLPSQLITWAAELSEVYGSCMVVPDVDTLPSSVEMLTTVGTPLYSRKVPRHDQRIGQGVPIAKPGWDMTEEKYRQAMVELQAQLTADTLAIHCPTTLDQLTAVIRDQDGNPVTQEGYQCDWAEAAAMAALTLPLASLWQARPAPLAFNPHHNPDSSPHQFDQWGGQLAVGG